ncbi:MAG TPA: GvpL/GvpF family gas vesicle protein [Chloroflexota bacterium]
MLYAYGATPARPRSLPVTGLYGQRVRLLRKPGLSVVYSEHEGPPGRDRERLQEHDRVNRSLMEHGPVVPFRFGNVFPDLASLERAVDGQQEALEHKLVELGTSVEMSIRLRRRAASEPVPATASASGTEYLERKAAELRRLEAAEAELRELAAALREAIGGAARDARENIVPPDELALAWLVERERLPEFEQATACFFQARPGWSRAWRAHVSGPWPPSSFV